MLNKKLRPVVKLVIVNLMVLLILILGIEGVVRIFIPKITIQGQDARMFQPGKFGTTYGLKPNITGTSFGARVVTDYQGFRIDPTLPVSPSKPNIIFLGDSVAMGVGVEAPSVFPYLLARKLRNYNIINAAVTGYSLKDYANVLESLPPTLNIEGSVICFCLNDIINFSQVNIVSSVNKDDNSIDKQYNYKDRYPNIFIRYLRLFNDRYFNFNKFLKSRFYFYQLVKAMTSDSSKNYFLADLDYYNKPDAVNIITSDFKHLRDIALRRGKWFVVIILPYEYQLRENNDNNLLPQKILLSITKNENIPMVDLYGSLYKYLLNHKLKSDYLYLFNDPMHLSNNGHKIISDLIYQQLIARHLID